jgi:GTP-binding protein
MNSRFKTITKGTGLMSSEFLEYRPHLGSLPHRISGSLIADRAGKTTAYALSSIQERGALFVGEGYDVYEGMIIGECARDNDLNVFASRPKKLTNVRATGSDGLTLLATPRKMSLEQCIEWIDDDDWIEVTPKVIRLRKKILAQNLRSVKRP